MFEMKITLEGAIIIAFLAVMLIIEFKTLVVTAQPQRA
jgi:hypothetical protein